jgi:hypothetical protein
MLAVVPVLSCFTCVEKGITIAGLSSEGVFFAAEACDGLILARGFLLPDDGEINWTMA